MWSEQTWRITGSWQWQFTFPAMQMPFLHWKHWIYSDKQIAITKTPGKQSARDRGRPTYSPPCTNIVSQDLFEMADEPLSLGNLFKEADVQKSVLASLSDTNSADYQNRLNSAINKYQKFLNAAERSGIFSPNESFDDISSGDLKYASCFAFQTIRPLILV